MVGVDGVRAIAKGAVADCLVSAGLAGAPVRLVPVGLAAVELAKA